MWTVTLVIDSDPSPSVPPAPEPANPALTMEKSRPSPMLWGAALSSTVGAAAWATFAASSRMASTSTLTVLVSETATELPSIAEAVTVSSGTTSLSLSAGGVRVTVRVTELTPPAAV